MTSLIIDCLILAYGLGFAGCALITIILLMVNLSAYKKRKEFNDNMFDLRVELSILEHLLKMFKCNKSVTHKFDIKNKYKSN